MTPSPSSLNDLLRFGGLSVDIRFGEPRPTFGELFQICGVPHPAFPVPPEREAIAARFAVLADLQFVQTGDDFGVLALPDAGGAIEGDDTVVSLAPLVAGAPVRHHPGPFDGVRLSFCVLRQPARRQAHFLTCIEALAALGMGAFYRERQQELGRPIALEPLRTDLADVTASWAAEGVVVGAEAALDIEF